MAETSTIADMARYSSREIFSVFGWRQVGLLDQNWKCTNKSDHLKATHPTDVVFYYDDPYTPYRTYINTDLKSYGGSTIDRAALAGALRSMTTAVECANSGSEWSELYDDGATNSVVLGMLFVYNHDENFKDDKGEFRGQLNTLSKEALVGAFGYPIVAFGPSDITFLFTVSHDIKALRGEGRLPMESTGKCMFWYADLVQAKRREQEFSAATIEMLSGPWIIMRTDTHSYTLWYRGHGSCEDEFRYLLEYLFFYQLLNHESASVDIRLVQSGQLALSHFAGAKEKFDRAHHRLATDRLKRITCDAVTGIRSSFSTVQLGWGDNTVTTHVRDPNLYLNDRNIFDGLKGTRKATTAVLLALARQRGLILSETMVHDDVLEYISRLTHSWHDIKAMIDLINTADRRERKTTRTIPFKKSTKELERILIQMKEKQAESRDEVWKVAVTNKGKTAIATIKYTMPDFNKSAMTRLTEHTCRIELTADNGTVLVRHDKQARAEQLVASVLRTLNEDVDQDRECEEIELSEVRSNRLRSDFFTKLIEGIEGFRLLEVSSVRGNNSSLKERPTQLDNKAAAALQSAIKKVTFMGRSLTGTKEYRQFFGNPKTEPDFHITSIAWVSDEVENSALRAEFEVSFSNQSACSGFSYRVRKVWYRTDGALRHAHSAPLPEDERRLMDVIEARAREVCRAIKLEAAQTKTSSN